MNYPIIFKLLSVIISTVAFAFVVSFGVGNLFYAGELEEYAHSGWIISITSAMVIAILFAWLGRKANTKIFRKEALAVIGLGWILASLVGAFPFALIHPNHDVFDAVFESTSGLTTTGASVYSNLEGMPKSLMFWRCLSQWIGGLGVVVFFVAILSFLGAGAKILYSNESSGSSNEFESSRVQKGVLNILYFYLGISITCAVTLKLCGMNAYDAICHMFTTIATGGFSTKNASIMAFQSPLIEWALIVFMMLSGTSFFFMFRMFRGDRKSIRENSEVKVYYAIIFGVSLIMTWVLHYGMQYPDLHDATRTAVFQVVSIITTTGYSSADYDAWIPISHAFLFIIMITGGCSGSTAGGLKIIRLVIISKVALFNIEKSFRSRVVRTIKINGRKLDKGDQENVMVYVVLLNLIAMASIIIVAFLEPAMSLDATHSAVLACFFNIGPGFNEIGPTKNFGFMHGYTKLFLSLLMIMGRLELYAILVLFSPSLWKRFS